MSYLVTGASGFLGRHLLEGPLKSEKVTVLVRNRQAWFAQNWTHNLGPIEIIEGELEGWSEWSDLESLRELQGIFHLAAMVKHSRSERQLILDTNVNGSLAMASLAAKKQCRLLFVSTSGTVGCFRDPDSAADEHAPYAESQVATWPYYASKIVAEKQLRVLAKQLGISLVIIRPPVMLGPGDHRLRSTAQIIRFLQGKLPVLIQGGMHFIDVREAAQACYRAMQLPEAQEIYHLPGHASELADFFSLVAKLSGHLPIKHVIPGRWLIPMATLEHTFGNLCRRPHGLGLLPDPVLIEMGSHYWGLRTLYADRDLGFQTRPAEQTLSDTIVWLKAEGLGKTR